MSVPDHQLDQPDAAPCACGALAMDGLAVCAECQAEVVDLYADEAIQDRLEGRRK